MSAVLLQVSLFILLIPHPLFLSSAKYFVFYTVSPHCEEKECVTLTEITKILHQEVNNTIACCCENSSNQFVKRK
jgi:hypothetical protein